MTTSRVAMCAGRARRGRDGGGGGVGVVFQAGSSSDALEGFGADARDGRGRWPSGSSRDGMRWWPVGALMGDARPASGDRVALFALLALWPLMNTAAGCCLLYSVLY